VGAESFTQGSGALAGTCCFLGGAGGFFPGDGALFFFLVDEMADITFSRSFSILMDALMASFQEILKLSDEQLTAFTADFEARLPKYLRNALHTEAVAA